MAVGFFPRGGGVRSDNVFDRGLWREQLAAPSSCRASIDFSQPRWRSAQRQQGALPFITHCSATA